MAVPDPVADVARRSAARLASEIDPNLPAATETAIATGGRPGWQARSFDAATAIALGALILGIAEFAWAIYRDLKKDRDEARERREKAAAEERKAADAATREVLLRRLRLEYPPQQFDSPTQRDRVFEVVVEEVLVSKGHAPSIDEP